MSQKDHDLRMDYIEFPATDIAASKRFYTAVFGWKFKDYGLEYTSFHDGRLAGGFNKDANPSGPAGGKTCGPLIVIYAAALEATYDKVKQAGGKIVRETFAFPGGRRFHFTDPNGNELAIWSE
jgi:predicted enzyme related to lactoylglutathione lyase